MKRFLKVSLVLLVVLVLSRLFSPYYSRLPVERLFCGNPERSNFFLVDDQDFQRLERPHYGDWLWHHPESGQSLWSYLRSNPPKPNRDEARIVLQPMGQFNTEQERLLEDVRDFCRAFFACEVQVASAIELDQKFSRQRDFGLQYKTPPLLNRVLVPMRPEDAFCYLGVTTEDLTYGDDWNFVYGSAVLKGKVGVFSLARYFPEFHGKGRTFETDSVVLRRSCKVVAHEAAHSLGLEHCVYYRCIMQGSNHLGEVDDKPLYLCPICLAKLNWSLELDLGKRYASLGNFLRKKGLKDDADWIERRLERYGLCEPKPQSP